MKWNAKLIIHGGFEVSIFLKGLYALMEIAGSVLVFFVRPDVLSDFIYKITANELKFDQHDWIATHLVEFAQTYSVHAQLFGFLYLLSHGLVKIFLVVNLWRRKPWAYPTAIVVFILFALYQLYLFVFNHSWFLGILTGLDLVVITLTWLEYRQIRTSGSVFRPR